jgi:hypothetical protein
MAFIRTFCSVRVSFIGNRPTVIPLCVFQYLQGERYLPAVAPNAVPGCRKFLEIAPLSGRSRVFAYRLKWATSSFDKQWRGRERLYAIGASSPASPKYLMVSLWRTLVSVIRMTCRATAARIDAKKLGHHTGLRTDLGRNLANSLHVDIVDFHFAEQRGDTDFQQFGSLCPVPAGRFQGTGNKPFFHYFSRFF